MPDLIFMDVNMPIMGGFEATRLIKQLGSTYVAALTGDSVSTI
jgi:CheY-like chemotaxis protein